MHVYIYICIGNCLDSFPVVQVPSLERRRFKASCRYESIIGIYYITAAAAAGLNNGLISAPPSQVHEYIR